MLAAAIGDIDTMKKLLELGADINVASNEMKLPSMTFPTKKLLYIMLLVQDK